MFGTYFNNFHQGTFWFLRKKISHIVHHNLHNIFEVVFSWPVWISIEASLHNWLIINGTIRKLEVNLPSRVIVYFLVSFSNLFRSKWKLIIYVSTMYGYCVYPAKSKGSKTTAKLSENSWKKRRSLSVFKGVSSVTSALTLLPFLSVAQEESGMHQ